MYTFPIAYLNTNNGSGLLAFGEGNTFISNTDNSLKDLQAFLDKSKGQYIFGFVSYDLKNQIEKLQSNNPDGLSFPDVCFWVPKYVVELKNEDLIILILKNLNYCIVRLHGEIVSFY